MSVRRLGVKICPETTAFAEVQGDVQEVDTCLRVFVGELDAWMERVQRLKETQFL